MNFIRILILILISGCVSQEADLSPLGKQVTASPFFISQIGTQTIATFGGSNAGHEICEEVVVDQLGNTICIGNSTGSLGAPSTGVKDIIVAKFNNSGKLLWIKQIASANNGIDEGWDIGVDLDGNIYGAGSTTKIMAPSTYADTGVDRGIGNIDQDTVVFKLLPNGSTVWIRQYGSTKEDVCYSLAVSPDGTTYCGGDTTGVLGTTYDGVPETNGGDEDAFILKYDKDGALQWSRQLGKINSSERAADVQRCRKLQLSGPDIWCGGQTQSSLFETNGGSYDIFFWVLNSAGALVKTKQFGSVSSIAGYFPSSDDFLRDFTVDASENVYFSIGGNGTFADNVADPQTQDIVIVKTNSNLDFTWSKKFSTNRVDRAEGLAMTPSNTLIVTGYTAGDLFGRNPDRTLSNKDIVIFGLDADGETLFSKQVGTTGEDYASSVFVDKNSHVTITGTTSGNLADTPIGRDIFILRTDSNFEM